MKVELGATPNSPSRNGTGFLPKACKCDAGRFGALLTGPTIAKMEKKLCKAPWLVKGLEPEVRAQKLAGKIKLVSTLGRKLSGSGKVVAVPFDGSGWDGSLTEVLC